VRALTEDKISILIVDDEPSVGDALRLVLESQGYEVVLVTKGMEGIDQARQRRFGFSVVDLFLTDISGFDVIEDIHKHSPEVPIVLITAHGSPQVFAEAKKLGAIGALHKPFPPAELLKIIDSHMHGPTDDSV
jgi:two-component system, NtrC family, response regulator GlrR